MIKKKLQTLCRLFTFSLFLNVCTLSLAPVQAAAETNTKSSSAFGYMEYTGYLDESGWSKRDAFKNCDYDGDGLTDRVFRKEQAGNTLTCSYRIDFGNGKRLWIRDADWTGTPVIQAGDLDADGRNEILFTQEYYMSTDPASAGNMRLYHNKGGKYKLAKLPLPNSVYNSFQPCLTLIYQIGKKDTYRLTVKETGYNAKFSFTKSSLEEMGLETFYNSFFDGEEEYETPVYKANIQKTGKRMSILCRVRLLGMFCADEIQFRIVSTDHGYAIKNMSYVPSKL